MTGSIDRRSFLVLSGGAVLAASGGDKRSAPPASSPPPTDPAHNGPAADVSSHRASGRSQPERADSARPRGEDRQRRRSRWQRPSSVRTRHRRRRLRGDGRRIGDPIRRSVPLRRRRPRRTNPLGARHRHRYFLCPQPPALRVVWRRASRRREDPRFSHPRRRLRCRLRRLQPTPRSHGAPQSVLSTANLFAKAPANAAPPPPLFAFRQPGEAVAASATPVSHVMLTFGGGPGSAPADWVWDPLPPRGREVRRARRTSSSQAHPSPPRTS